MILGPRGRLCGRLRSGLRPRPGQRPALAQRRQLPLQTLDPGRHGAVGVGPHDEQPRHQQLQQQARAGGARHLAQGGGGIICGLDAGKEARLNGTEKFLLGKSIVVTDARALCFVGGW